jgi:hypothetical protein
MNFLPIAIRELQVTARRTMTYWWRSLSALNAACITLGCLLVGFSGAVSASQAGEMTFQILSGVGYVVTALTAALATSDCISEERRDGTLGFLFLTDLKGYDIILGKLARLSVPVYCLAAAFPTLGFTMLLGGVSLGDFAMIALSLVNALFFFSALGLLVSARSWDGRAAVSASMMGVVIFSAPAAAALAGLPFWGAWEAVLVPTPAGAFLAALESASTTISKPDFFLSLVVSHALGWLFIAAASLFVTRSFSREEPKAAARTRSPSGPNPSMSLHVRDEGRKPWRPVWLLAALVAMIAVLARVISPTNWYDIPTFAGIVLGLHLILKFWTAHSACRSLPSRRLSGELEILLTTPLDGDAILLGSTTAIKHQLLRPFLFVVAMDLLLLILGWQKLGIWAGFGFAGAMLLEFLWFIGNLYSLTWVGLWMGLKTSSHAKALGRTLFYLLLLPWSFLAVAAAFVGIMSMGHNLNPGMGALTFAEFVVALAVCNLGFTGWAVSELRDHFRLLAASQTLSPDRFAPPLNSILGKLRFWHLKRAPQAA